MGVLDEAIRQHLELKRAHGASEDELQRQEAEALGPARREPPARSARDEDGVIVDEAGGDASDIEPGPDRPAVGAEAPASDAEPDEVVADEALDAGPAGRGEAVAGQEPPRVFDLEELGPPEDRAPPPNTGTPLAPAPEPDTELADVVPLEAVDAEEAGSPADDEILDADEEILDAEEEAEEELAEELAGAGPPPGHDPERPPPAVTDAPGAGEPASFEDDTIYHPPPAGAPADAETDEYVLEEEPVKSGSAPEGAAVGGIEENLLEEELEEDLLEEELEEEVLGDDLELEEAGPPPGEHVAGDEDLDLEDDLDAEAEAGAAPPDDPQRRGQGGQPEGPAAAGDEDVLEETPEFLEEAPDHERLWFEQKPPRDFDLDR